MPKFKFLEHTADIKFQAFGRSMEEVFKNSILATSEAMYDGDVGKTLTNEINIEGTDKENLLYNALDEIVFLFDSENFLVSEVKNLKIRKSGEGFELQATITGDSSEKYDIQEHIKSVTYNEMFVREENGKWTAQVVLDV
jgi:SHS2 domain-containing protein